MVKIESIVKEALNDIFSPIIIKGLAEKIEAKAKEKQLVLMESRFVKWEDFGFKRPDIWLDGSQEPIEFAIRRKGMKNSELALFDGRGFYWVEKGRKFYFKEVTHWVQMPRLLW